MRWNYGCTFKAGTYKILEIVVSGFPVCSQIECYFSGNRASVKIPIGASCSGLEQNSFELQYISICNSNPVLEWPQRLHSGLECSAMIAINQDCIVPESENRIQLITVRCVFRLIRIVTLKADYGMPVTESGILCKDR